MYPPVNPILVQIGSLSIHWYGVIMTLAIFLAALTASRYVTRHGEDGNVIWDMLLWVLIPAIIGARLYFVFIQSPRGPDGIGRYLADPKQILEIWNGGIHIYGALIFGAIALYLYLRIHKLPYAKYLDGAALGLALGQAIGRLGNFINQELYGPPTTLPWGLKIDQDHRIPPYDNTVLYPDSTRFQPLFLYEMIWDLIGFGLILWISRRFAKRLRPGDVFCMYLIWVPLGRFFLEFMRTDSWFFPGTPFNTAHILTGGAVICGAVFLYLRHRHPLTPEQLAFEQNGAGEVGEEQEIGATATGEEESGSIDHTSEPQESMTDTAAPAEPVEKEAASEVLVERPADVTPVETIQEHEPEKIETVASSSSVDDAQSSASDTQ